jgi:2,4-dienoyl-CoA reductase-like NADH-dependent reductase (Old Yellow Enzyme family)
MKFGDYPKIKAHPTAQAFRDHARELGVEVPCDDAIIGGDASPLAQPLTVGRFTIGNRFAVQPMEGWDGESDGAPSENTLRRWKHFGASGAKLVWGGEAVAVRHDGRANPQQVTLTEKTQAGIAKLREVLIAAHREAMGDDRGLVIGLQLTHSGRFARPNDKKRLEPQILYRHPVLDRKFGVAADHGLMTDGEIRRLIDDYVSAAKRAAACGYDFVDLKHCHGYLGHEFLSAHTRGGEFGGSFENRTRFLRELAAGVRAEAPGLEIGVRVSAFDLVPFRPDPARSTAEELGPGVPDDYAAALPYRYGFGVNPERPVEMDLTETRAFLAMLREQNIRMVNVTAGSPYYNPHLTRPALYPPSDGYHPPEDPLVGVARHLDVVRQLKHDFPDIALMGSGYTYLQEYLPHVAQAVVRAGWTDFVGIGRLMLSYPELPRDVLKTGAIQRKRLCRTFSDCTTAPRNGLVSGCYPLDGHYKKSPEAVVLARIKNPKQAA